MQLRYPTRLTGEQYVDVRAWRDARLERCPNHPHGRCSFARHGTYTRKTPRGTRIARWYCPESHTTFSLLPDCLAAHLPDTLDALETVVDCAERASSIKAAATELRRDFIELPGALRWVQRRVQLVDRFLTAVGKSPPEQLDPFVSSVGALRTRLKTQRALTELRELVASRLSELPAPLGFPQKGFHSVSRKFDVQHKVGHDPPSFGA